MALITPPTLVLPFAALAGSTYIVNPIPVPSQIGTDNGAASYTDGFPPLTFVALPDGGAAVRGNDVNGILFAISAHSVWANAGGQYKFSSTIAAAIGGYPIGVMLQQVADPTAFWVNLFAGNSTDPDGGGATAESRWMSTRPIYFTAAPAAGTYNNVVLRGASDYVLDIDTTAGDVTYTGITAQRDGQRVFITNTGANAFAVKSLDSGSSSGARFRLPADLTFLQYQTLTLQYSTGASKWIAI